MVTVDASGFGVGRLRLSEESKVEVVHVTYLNLFQDLCVILISRQGVDVRKNSKFVVNLGGRILSRYKGGFP